jgi:hypothetical protein
MVNFTPLPLYSWGNSLRYALYGRLGESQSRSRRCVEEKNLLSLRGIEFQFLDHPARSLDTTLHTEWAILDPVWEEIRKLHSRSDDPDIY